MLQRFEFSRAALNDNTMSDLTINAFTLLTQRRESGSPVKQSKNGKRKVPEGGEENASPQNEDSRRYKWLLQVRYRKPFLNKFGPIIRANGNGITLGGQNGVCWMITGYQAKNKGGPRASYQVYLEGRDVRVTVSGAKAAVIFRLIQEAGKDGDTLVDVQWPYPDHFEASHICHSSNCLRPSHIVMEPRSVNEERNHCSGEIECPRCTIILDACTHVPHCIWRVEATRCSVCGFGMTR